MTPKFKKGDKAITTTSKQEVEILSDARKCGNTFCSQFHYQTTLSDMIESQLQKLTDEEEPELEQEPVIKPCPFCGVKVAIERNPGVYGYTTSSVYIRCRKCGSGFSEPAEKWEMHRGYFSVEAEARKKVITRWNTRLDC